MIETKKDLQEQLIDLIDYATVRREKVYTEIDNDEYTEEEVYMIGKLDGMREACEALYLATFGGKAYGDLLRMLAEKRKGGEDAESSEW